ncbi:MAG: hypothetical protein A2W61_05500 [Deltaproteobacteria bacterium RIFCSPLOWO2_01_44_7]|nr:MAG: hypothetical protein A2712_07820 [Deltaproteobacteria bacterium RIFCSPHIGHO2_01_FULL_43_49]OGQ14752.1 MAG: hypothetical protein A3D22_09175 [Deltaproteobacteria bacterium RIFCSPHIGHO2_02_FULL_44_53]OGQ28138.1 MAG: hypothetical protein A3D98_07885 [Deltaproteobacteria bacterium RIFCSPHIGHO2_12_FULL_44_21]OGQ31350.1 MAG: hypothetical protein A2979_07935 [Deltaproteobacteria bacterium RIFCSPLOWO2_01_FULL_45_74]OGQ43342.1 MAG: hypothetical protein A3I70_01595 [Deltaproteobacteria bacterium 
MGDIKIPEGCRVGAIYHSRDGSNPETSKKAYECADALQKNTGKLHTVKHESDCTEDKWCWDRFEVIEGHSKK